MARRDKDGNAPGTYEVGYARPPESHRFKPGQSGNPKGRPKGAMGIAASLKRELEAKVTVREGDRQVKMTKAEALAKRLVSKALAGELPAIKMLAALDEGLSGHVLAPSAEAEAASGPEQTDRDLLKWFMSLASDGVFRDGGNEP